MKKCKVEECGRIEYAGGYCSTHYNRLRTTGTLEPGPKARLPLRDRLYRQIKVGGPDECWNWTAGTSTTGYGLIGLGGRSAGKRLAHRVMWELVNGPIPKSSEHHGMVVMHTCDNRLCLNPRHLLLGRQSDNVRDMDRKGRRVNAQLSGEKHHNSKLTDEQVREIRASKESAAVIAKRMGVTKTNVNYIRRGDTWTHVK